MTRILVVASEPFLGRALTEFGADVHEARDGARALELVESIAYRLMLLDIPLVDGDGPELLGKLLAVRPERPVVLLCGPPDRETKTRCLELGVTDYMTKPISLPRLLAHVGSTFARSAATEERVLRAGTLTLDLQRRAVEVGDEQIPLTGREFRLLRHLMLQEGEVCTRMELLSEVWGYTFDPGTNVVDVCIRRLRAKVGSRRIETIRSVGYAFQALRAEPVAQAVTA